MNRHLCIHAHFYQPPRENAWLEDVEMQDSAYPYHDWNERIAAEGYAPNTASRVVNGEGRIIDIINNYAKISFNIGPTLFQWMARRMPEIYEDIIQADHHSRELYSGHGSAIAQAFGHLIMPLANDRDKRTQAYWGVRDFEFRFGRKPEGMWLPETACDLASLEALADQGIKFTILSPYQAGRVRPLDGGEDDWRDATGGQIDPKIPYLCRLPSGNTIALFFYDGPISQELGFGDLLTSGENFANRLLGVFGEQDDPQMVHIATDGETYGHHKTFGDMALAYCIYFIESNELADVTIYGEYLEKYPPTQEVEIVENTSWSCAHGVERWRSDCGCNSGMHPAWNQKWRTPLREALDWLRDQMIPIYEQEMRKFTGDPWKARDEYISVILDRTPETIDRYLGEHIGGDLTHGNKVRLLKLLEMQRQALQMFTSCGWFFDELSGLETTQVLQYAARAIQLTRELTGKDLEPTFKRRLERAKSNIPEMGNGAQIYHRFIEPARLDLERVGAHYAISSLFEDYPEDEYKIYCYTADSQSHEQVRAGTMQLAVGHALIRSDVTLEQKDISYAVIHMGGHIINGGVREYQGEEAFEDMRQAVTEAFDRTDVPEVIRLMDQHFGGSNYSLWHLFKDEQHKVFDLLLQETLDRIEVNFRNIFNDNYAIMRAMRDSGIPIPQALRTPMEFSLNREIYRMLMEGAEIDIPRLEKLVEEFHTWEAAPNRTALNHASEIWINVTMRRLVENPRDMEILAVMREVIKLLKAIPVELNLWRAQNMYFDLARQVRMEIAEKADQGGGEERRWVESFDELGEHLNVRLGYAFTTSDVPAAV
ncbi:MAG: DUF3536 domain-containing protein [Candidatus Zixiibacteriota bacterium]|nr:MAG: DUF3536 domain-containing protein [candidate division Zixibacteria bacterium]